MTGLPTGHHSQAELAAVLAAAQDEEAVLIGGQAIAIWVQRYADIFPRTIDPITSADVDFFGSARKAKMVASRLQNAQVYLPVPFEDLTPNSAMIKALVGAHPVTIDFMGQIVWVDEDDIAGRFLTLEGELSEPGGTIRIKILCLHPIDCLKNRLGNINVLRRIDIFAVQSAEASVMILDAFIDEILTLGWNRHATNCFRELEFIVRNKCAGHPSFLQFGVDPTPILERYSKDERLDLRYRTLTMKGQLERVKSALAK